MFADRFTVEKRRDLAAFQAAEASPRRRLRVCIVTEEIYGPIRNGGIATTYFYLAAMLAEEGHEVSVLYVRGQHSENGPIGEWVRFYAERGIEFVPLSGDELPLDAVEDLRLWKYAAVFDWLRRNQRFDVVHTSEWRGAAYYALIAKQAGLFFEDILFLVKSSSPWIWNRHYMNGLTDRRDEHIFMHAEKACIELADIVIGGSAHLLSFMQDCGYEVPTERTFVQPNIIDFSSLVIDDKRGEREPGQRLDVDHWVFFGRLEMRKGLHLFCDALDHLASLGRTPRKVSFLGKCGQGFPGEPLAMADSYINERAARWPFEVVLVTDRQQNEAIQYMVEEDCLAVMPSIIENSTMAVYEALIHRVPFIASDVGGTPELIEATDHAAVLCRPTAMSIAESLLRTIGDGALIARETFDPQDNIETWKGFHRWLSQRFEHDTAATIRADMSSVAPRPIPVRAHPVEPCSVAVCLIADQRTTAENLRAQVEEMMAAGTLPQRLRVAVTGPSPQATLERLRDAVPVQGKVTIEYLVAEPSGRDIGAALNALCEVPAAWRLVCRVSQTRLARGAITVLCRPGASPAAGVISWGEQAGSGSGAAVRLPMIENDAGFLGDPWVLGGPSLAISERYWDSGARFLEGGEFAAPEQEFLLRAAHARELAALPLRLAARMRPFEHAAATPYYLRRPILERMPFSSRALLLSRDLDPELKETGYTFGPVRITTRLARLMQKLRRRIRRNPDFH